jgi:hypothetical protein
MSDLFTDDNVTAGCDALMKFWQKGGLSRTEVQAVEVIVAAVAPAIAARALRQAADDLPWSGRRLGEILRARADTLEPSFAMRLAEQSRQAWNAEHPDAPMPPLDALEADQ